MPAWFENTDREGQTKSRTFLHLSMKSITHDNDINSVIVLRTVKGVLEGLSPHTHGISWMYVYIIHRPSSRPYWLC